MWGLPHGLEAGLKGDHAIRKRGWEGETETTVRNRVLFVSQPWLSCSITSAIFYSQLTRTLALLPSPDPFSLPPPLTHPAQHTQQSPLWLQSYLWGEDFLYGFLPFIGKFMTRQSTRLKHCELYPVFSSASAPPLYPGSRCLAELALGPGHGEPGRDLEALLSTKRTARLVGVFHWSVACSVRNPDLGQLGSLLVAVGAACALVWLPGFQILPLFPASRG